MRQREFIKLLTPRPSHGGAQQSPTKFPVIVRAPVGEEDVYLSVFAEIP
ncbi:MAG: hypothetical protein WAV38_37595 [Xanthobacteraceae bacterium]|jgi:hypothetical protein